MTGWEAVIGNLPTILTSGGVTLTAVLSSLILLVARGTLSTRWQVNKLLEAKDGIITLLKEQLISERADQARQLTRANQETDLYRTSTDTQRERADAVTDKMIGEVVPLIRVTNKLLGAIPTVEDGDDDAKPGQSRRGNSARNQPRSR